MLRKSALLVLLSLLFALSASSATIPKRTKLTVETQSELNSDQTLPGDSFETRMTNDLIVQGKVVVPAGTIVRGHVIDAVSSKGLSTPGALKLELISIELDHPHSIATSTVSRYGQGTSKQVDQIERRRAAADQVASVIRDATHPPDSMPGVPVGDQDQRSSSPQVFLPPGTVLTFTLRVPLEINPPNDKQK
jgi:hypothetical protein